jgi:hypothetical protein
MGKKPMMNAVAKITKSGPLMFVAKALIALGPVAVVGRLLLLKVQNSRGYMQIVREDGPVENWTSLLYFFAFVVAGLIGWGFKKQGQGILRILYAGLALGCLFVALEEIGWGQRILNFQSPEVFQKYNGHQETNVHNFMGRYLLHGMFLIVGGFGAFAAFLIPSKIRNRFPNTVKLFVPGRTLFMYFFAAFSFYAYFDYVGPGMGMVFGEQFDARSVEGHKGIVGAKDQEVVELVLAAGFLFFSMANLWRQRMGAFDELRATWPLVPERVEARRRKGSKL